MTRKSTIFSFLCVIIVSAMSIYAWVNLPDLAEYPVHWNIRGEVDGYGSRKTVLMILAMFPVLVLFLTGLFYAIPKIEPLRQNLENSRRAYNIACTLLLGFHVIVGAFMALLFISPDGAITQAFPRLVLISTSLVFIGIGNVLGKVRQNFMFGIRTPWTLSSEFSWEKTHRLGGRGFVTVGFVSIIGAIILPMTLAFIVFTISILAFVLFVFIYSFIIWKGDPHKRS